MSWGTVCLICRKYIGTHDWCCQCVKPIPSDDGKTPNDNTQAAMPAEEA